MNFSCAAFPSKRDGKAAMGPYWATATEVNSIVVQSQRSGSLAHTVGEGVCCFRRLLMPARGPFAGSSALGAASKTRTRPLPATRYR